MLLRGVKYGKLGTTLVEIYASKRRQNLGEADMGSYCNQEKWLKDFSDGKGAFYDGSKSKLQKQRRKNRSREA